MAEKLPVTPDLLVELELIKRAKYAYLRMVDQPRFDDLHEVMTDDCTAAYSDGEYSFDDLTGIVAFLHENMGRDQFLSSHASYRRQEDYFVGLKVRSSAARYRELKSLSSPLCKLSIHTRR